MKKFKLLALAAIASVPLIFAQTSCSSNDAIGILLPAEHPALDAAKDGFIKALEDNGDDISKVVVKNANGQSDKLTILAKDLVSRSKLTLGIGTGASVALMGQEVNQGITKPLLFTAVTDPVDAGLVESADNPSGFVCGTTDANPVEAQISLIKEFNPEFDKLGIFYTSTEINSKVQADQAKNAAELQGISVSVKTCTGTSDLAANIEALAGEEGLDAIYIPTDNNVAANMNTVKVAADNHGVLVVAGEENQVKNGAHLTLSLDYYNLGYSTGVMAHEILAGNKNPTDYKVVPVPASDCAYVFSSANLADSHLSMSDTLLNAHDWKDISAE